MPPTGAARGRGRQPANPVTRTQNSAAVGRSGSVSSLNSGSGNSARSIASPVNSDSGASSPRHSGSRASVGDSSHHGHKQNDAVKVVLRIRPFSQVETQNGYTSCLEHDADGRSVHVTGAPSFGFDAVLPMDATQERVYTVAAEPIVQAVLQGYNGTIFSYGQTGTGKTYTMVGEIDDERLRGVIPRVAESLFVGIAAAAADAEFTIRCSYLEIYLERVRDLLDPSGSRENLPIHESKEHGIWCAGRGPGRGAGADGAGQGRGATAQYVASPDEMLDLLAAGNAQRAVAATRANAESSRSHAVFIVTVKRQSAGDGRATTGKLCLVDLAGSEKIRDSDVEGQQLEELKINNKSLSALGMVINALTDGRSTHVPYRDSKLTRLLQESLGGNARTALVLTATPAAAYQAETVSTLRFGQRAKKMRNSPRVNLEMSPAELRALLAAASRDIAVLKAENTALRGKIEQLTGEAVPPRASKPPLKPDVPPSPRLERLRSDPLPVNLSPIASEDSELASAEEAALSLGRRLAGDLSASPLPPLPSIPSTSDDGSTGGSSGPAPPTQRGAPPPFVVLQRRLSSCTFGGVHPRNVIRPISALDATVAMRSRSLANIIDGEGPRDFRAHSLAVLPSPSAPGPPSDMSIAGMRTPSEASGTSTPAVPRRISSSGNLDPASPPLRPAAARPASMETLGVHGGSSGSLRSPGGRSPAPPSPMLTVTALGGGEDPPALQLALASAAPARTPDPARVRSPPPASDAGSEGAPSPAAPRGSGASAGPAPALDRPCCSHEEDLRAVREQEGRLAALLGDIVSRLDEARLGSIQEGMRGASSLRSAVDKSNAILATVMVDSRLLREALASEEGWRAGAEGAGRLAVSAPLVECTARVVFDCADARRTANLCTEEVERTALSGLADGKFGGVLCPFV
eukprot:tig00000451_g971.t1